MTASRRWSSAWTAPAVRCSRPNASVRRSYRQGQEDPRRRVDGQRGRVGRLLGLDTGRLHLRRAVDHHRLDRRVRDIPSFQGTLQKLGIGADGVKTTPLSGEPDLLKGPSPEASQLIQSGRQFDVRALPQRRRPGAAQDPAAGERHRAGPRVGRRHRPSARPGGGFGGIDEPSPRRHSSQGSETSGASATSSSRTSFKERADRGAR